MVPPNITRVTRPFLVTYVLLFLGLSYFAIYPAFQQSEGMTLAVTLIWMVILAGIVATYALAVVLLAGDE